MAKDPAVLFYYQDFLVGTEFMTDEEIGKYIKILCHQADKGPLTKQQVLIICHSSDIPNCIQEKLKTTEDGLYYNKRMKEEKEKRLNFSKSRSNNRLSKRSVKDMNDISLTSDAHMENTNENTNEDLKEEGECKEGDLIDKENNDGEINNVIIPPDFEQPSLSQVKAFFLHSSLPVIDAENFWSHYDGLGWETRGQPIKRWTSLVTKWMNNSKQFNQVQENNGKIKNESAGSIKSRLDYRPDPAKYEQRLKDLNKQFGED